MAVSAGQNVAVRLAICDPDAHVAAWFAEMPNGRMLLAVNDALMEQPGAREWAESWFRLRARTQRHAFGVLPVADLALYAHHVVGHQHVDGA